MVRTRHMAQTSGEPVSDTEMEASPRILQLPAPYELSEEEEENNNNVIALRQNPNEALTMLPFAIPETTFESLSTQLPTTVKIEELHFQYS